MKSTSNQIRCAEKCTVLYHLVLLKCWSLNISYSAQTGGATRFIILFNSPSTKYKIKMKVIINLYFIFIFSVPTAKFDWHSQEEQDWFYTSMYLASLIGFRLVRVYKDTWPFLIFPPTWNGLYMKNWRNSCERFPSRYKTCRVGPPLFLKSLVFRLKTGEGREIWARKIKIGSFS